jgi:phytanoyl-CoA hydroxylase
MNPDRTTALQQPRHFALSKKQRQDFARDGYLIVRGLAAPARCRALIDEIDRCLAPPLGPLELEAELGYPGAPAGIAARGGQTPRRLLNAYSRGPLFRDWARAPEVTQPLTDLLDRRPFALVQAHHNCIMTKYPEYGSETGWHQDIRYWSFAAPELINAWLALGPEGRAEGGMRVIPGTHRMRLEPAQFDAALFLRPDLPENRPLLGRAVDLELDCGDVLFFHCRLLHAAGRNATERVKRSLVFTYNPMGNEPLPGSRSARLAQIPLTAGEQL